MIYITWMKYRKEFTINCINVLLLIIGSALFITKFKPTSEIGSIGLILFVFFVAYGNAIYMFSRHGYFKRLKSHAPASQDVVDLALLNHPPALVILVPSYKEELPVIRQSILSSALQNYPNRRVVLLIDNPPDCPALKATQDLVIEINAELKEQYLKYADYRGDLIAAYEEIATWFETQGNIYQIRDHTDKTFVDLTFTKRAVNIRERILVVKNFDNVALNREYAILANIFKVDMSYFERKQFSNFSHASNKSMNLNSYLTVLGKHWKKSETCLIESTSSDFDHYFPDVEYISVLDADSVLTYDYASRLIYEMEQEAFKKVAVIQTPYSAFPEAPYAIERTAGAATDIYFLFHQGFTYFGATFWVGANALIRKKALGDVVEHRVEDGKHISIFVQDRTVIEDTESSVDLVAKGWTLYNFPERLSFSATPADFGSLLIQRKRWANGGLIILPKLLKYLFQGPLNLSRWRECFFRLYYLISTPGWILCFCLMQFSSSVSTADFPLEIALLTIPCLLLHAHDLKRFGYRYTDLLGYMALNIVLIPVTAAGVLQSLKQVFFDKRTPFFRTPKISESTPVPVVYPLFFITMLSSFGYNAFMNRSVSEVFLLVLFLYGLAICFLKIPSKFQAKRVLTKQNVESQAWDSETASKIYSGECIES